MKNKLNFRIQYDYDNGEETIMSYGTYYTYEVGLKGQNNTPTPITGMLEEDLDRIYEEFKEINPIETVYVKHKMEYQRQKFSDIRKDTQHKNLVRRIKFDSDAAALLQHNGWQEKEKDAEEDKVTQALGTELQNFLNFDIDEFIDGNYTILWEHEPGDEYEKLVGWVQGPGHDLRNLYIRDLMSLNMVYTTEDIDEIFFRMIPPYESIPFFIRMYSDLFIDMKNWKYNEAGIKYIKSIQERIIKFCEKVFFPEDTKDKRTAYKRYYDNIEPIEKEEFKKRAVSGLEKTDTSKITLEQALAIELYAMIKKNVGFIKCRNCGLYTIVKNKKSKSCNRAYYGGFFYGPNQSDKKDNEDNEKKNEDYCLNKYYYICNEDSNIKITQENQLSNVIKKVSNGEKKRLYNHIDRHSKLKGENDNSIRDKIVQSLSIFILENEDKYIKSFDSASDNEKKKIQAEYRTKLIEEVNKTIKEIMGPGVPKEYLFDRKKKIKE